MKRTLASVVALLICAQFFTPTQARADVPPSADTTCSLTNKGVQFSASLIFNGGNWTINGINYDWEYAILNQGQNPGISSSYGTRALAKTTVPNGVEFTYEELLALASGNPDSTIIIFSIPKLIIGSSTITNSQRGSGCYVALTAVLESKNNAAAKAALPKTTPEESKPSTAGDTGAEGIFTGLRTEKKLIDTQILGIMRISKSIGSNLTKMVLGGMPKIPEDGSTYSLAQAMVIKEKFDAFVLSYRKLSEKWISDFKKQKVGCVKGSLRTTIKAGTKCPPGYKKQ